MDAPSLTLWCFTPASETGVTNLSSSLTNVPRHAAFVRITHWVTVVAFLALLVSGVEVLLSHPRFYWGEVGNVNTSPLFALPVPSSRGTVPTSFNFVLPDQNGWSRYLHFQAAWLLLFTGLVYMWRAARSGHITRDLVPAAPDRSWRALIRNLVEHLRFDPQAVGDPGSYNALQRVAYLTVLFVLFPLIIWTGLAMAPAFTAVFPSSVALLGGRQSARTLHFVVTLLLVLFLVTHVLMIVVAGFRARMRPMFISTAEELP
ncbi:MAG: cytochrome b/b6 domain-containing protein [Gemmatimonadaceae bacterium]